MNICRRPGALRKSGSVAVWLTLALLVIDCRAREKLYDDERVFSPLEAGESFKLTAISGPRHVIVNFFAPDCPPCEKEVPALKAFNEAHHKNPAVRFVSIGSALSAVGSKAGSAPSREEIAREVRAFVAKYRVNWPQHLAESVDLTAWRVTGFPETFVFKYDGKHWQLQRKYISEVTRENLENELGGIRK